MRWLILACLLLTGCDIRFTTEPVLFCVVDGDTIAVPNDSTGIRCAPVDPGSLPDSISG